MPCSLGCWRCVCISHEFCSGVGMERAGFHFFQLRPTRWSLRPFKKPPALQKKTRPLLLDAESQRRLDGEAEVEQPPFILSASVQRSRPAWLDTRAGQQFYTMSSSTCFLPPHALCCCRSVWDGIQPTVFVVLVALHTLQTLPFSIRLPADGNITAEGLLCPARLPRPHRHSTVILQVAALRPLCFLSIYFFLRHKVYLSLARPES